MRPTRDNTASRFFLLGLLLALGGWSIVARAVDPDPAVPAKTAGPAKTETPAKPAEKALAFEMRDKPWIQVLEWLSDQSGLPFISQYKPTGSFTFITPKGGPKQYTISQIIDILNEALLAQKFILIRRNASLTMIPADEKIDPAILPRLNLDELNHRGNTELASVVLPLTSLVAEDIAPEVKKMMGPFGEVVAMAKANQLVLQDTVGNLKRIHKTIKDIEENEKGQADTFTHTCKYVKARDAEKTLRDLLGDPAVIIRALQQAQQPQFPSFPGAPPRPSSTPTPAPKVRMHYISSDERTNSVLVTGPADKIAQAREIMKKLDVAHPGQQAVIIGPPILKTYAVPGGNAEALAKTLQEQYKASNNVRISAVGNNSVMVWALPDDQIDIARHILGVTESNTTTELLPLNTLEAGKIADSLKAMFGDHKTGGPYIEGETTRNAIMVRGTREQVAEVKAALKALGEGGGGGGLSSNIRIITLDKGSAVTLAEALERLLPQMRQNPVKVISPSSGSTTPKESEPPKKTEPTKESEPSKKTEPPKESQPPKKTEPPKDNSSQDVEEDDVQDAPKEKSDPKQLSDPQEKKPAKDDRPGKADAPVNITAFGNRLIITSDDPQALALTQELIRLLTQSTGGEGDFEVIKLKNASASDAAKILDEAFNGTKPQTGAGQQGGSFSGFFSRFGGGGSRDAGPTPPANPSANRIRVVADPATNSLLVRASPLDLLTIRRLLDKAIDTGNTDSRAIARTWVIGPLKYANATEVVYVVRDVYREQMNNNFSTTTVGGFSEVGFFASRSRGVQNMNLDANGNPRAVTLSVGVDDRSNSLVVSCSQAMYEDVKKLVEQLELAAKDSTRTVKVVSIKGVDPLLVQQAIDAIQGRRTNFRSGQGTGSMGSGGTSGGFSPFGSGGFSPGGTGPSRSFGPGDGPGSGSGPPGGSRRGGGPRGSGRAPGPDDQRGPDFFAERVKDDPEPTLLYDPQQSVAPSHQTVAAGLHEEEEQQAPPATTGETSPDVRGPRSPVTAEALEQLGVIVISGNNQADVEEIVRIIEYIQKLGAGAEFQIQLVPLEHADATSVAHTLSQLFQQVIVGATGNVRGALTGSTTTTTTQPQTGAQTQTNQQQQSSVVLLPLARFNAILMAAPRARVDDIVNEIKRLDRPTPPQGQATPFPLKKASAARVATLIQQFYAQRYPNETAAQHQIRVTYDDSTNTVFVQAAPADLTEIRGLIERIDNTVSSAVNDLRIVPLRNALAEELTYLLQQAISQGLVSPSASAVPGVVPSAPGAGLQGGLRPGGGGAPGLGQAGLGQAGLGQPGLGQSGLGQSGLGTGIGGQIGVPTKSTSLRFISGLRDGFGVFESGLLDDIHITPDARTNSLILAAPTKTIELMLALIRELDVVPAARAEIKIFSLKKADAAATANLLQQLFLGATGASGLGAGLPGGGIPGAAGATGGVSVTSTTFGGAAGIPRPLLTLGGRLPDSAPLVDLRLTIDQRTNSLIVAGAQYDLDVVEAIISRLEDSDIQIRHNQVIHLKNASAADVANALQSFITRSLQVLAQGQQLTAFQEIQRDVVVVPEPITNKIIISATPQYFGDIIQLIRELDAEPPQVVIQVLIAEVDLDDAEDFGVEIGLQNPVLFQRSIIPAFNFLGSNGVINYANPGLVPQGVTVNNSINPAALPGYAFNSTTPLGNNPVVGAGIVGLQGLGNLGVGRARAGTNIGGFVFSAASDSFNLLIRALKTQQRMEILSRPQVTTLDNQSARILVGQSFPYTTGTNVTATGVIVNNINYRDIGTQLQVTPRITPDNKVIMRVVPEVSSAVQGTTVDLGNGNFATIFNVQTVETTVLALDGETVALGGLIQKTDVKNENKIPWFSDLPWVGSLFRYRTQAKKKTELLVILTPHIVRSAFEADRILAEEAKRIDWVLGDVKKFHVTPGREPSFLPSAGPDLPGTPNQGRMEPPPLGPVVPPIEAPVPIETLPPPRPVPSPVLPYQSAMPIPAMPAAAVTPSPVSNSTEEKERRGWNPFRRN